MLVCGGRDYHDYAKMGEVLDELKLSDTLFIIEGGAGGADSWARFWARNRNIPCATVAAWWQHGLAAGPIRNSWMLLLEPDLVLAFPGGKGTADMVRQAKAAGVEVREVER